MIKIFLLLLLAVLLLVYLRRKVASIPTFRWLMKIVLATTTVLILGILTEIF